MSAINLISLTAGLVGALLIGLWVRDELQMDKFHSNDEQLYQAIMFWDYGESNSTSEYTQGPLARTLPESIPEIEAATNISPVFTSFNFQVEEENYATAGFYVGEDFFDVFDFKLLQGKSDEVLQQVNSVVISESAALKWFGKTEAVIGKVAQLEGAENMIVSGVFKDPPIQSTLQFDCLMSYDKLVAFQPNRDSWGSVSFYTMLTLNENANLETVTEKINQSIQSNFEEEIEFSTFLRPFSDGYLYGEYENGEVVGGRIEYVRLFGIIGVFLLLIACINFMNLATAQASKRLKEVGIKKTLGSKRGQLILQYLSESFSIAMLSLVTALGIVWLALPAFNNLTEKSIALNITPFWVVILLGLTAVIGLSAGSYPAFYISSFQPLKILKGISNSNKKTAGVRRFLVVFQFAIAIVLMVGVVVVYQQIQFVQNKSLGYEKDNLIEFFMVIEDRERINTFVSEAQQLAGVANVSSGNTPINHRNRTMDVSWEGKDTEFDQYFYLYSSYYDLPETTGMKLKEGRTLSKEYGDERHKAILNESAVKAIGIENPIGQSIQLWEQVDLEIIGVVEDFHYQSLHETIQPLIFRFMQNASPMLVARLEEGREKEALAGLQYLYQKFNPTVPFSFEFIDQKYDKLYTSEQKVASLSQLFAGFALLISCLGLFGLALFLAERKQKEISVRKVLGASIASILQLLSKEFLLLISISMLVGFPIAWYLSNSWLEQFAYHMNLQWWLFAGVGIAILSIALLTVSFQSMRAALANPIDALMNE